jgi:NADPH:quinone reductase-like Zn-dependent oxidoreductase
MRIAMKAIVQDRYGSPNVLQCKDIDKPVVSDDEVLVRVHAGGGQYRRLAPPQGRAVRHAHGGRPAQAEARDPGN